MNERRGVWGRIHGKGLVLWLENTGTGNGVDSPRCPCIREILCILSKHTGIH